MDSQVVFNKSNLPDCVIQAGIQSEPKTRCSLTGRARRSQRNSQQAVGGLP